MSFGAFNLFWDRLRIINDPGDAAYSSAFSIAFDT